MLAPYVLVLIPAAIGTVLGAIACFMPGTGVTGTAGAILALVGAAATTLGALLALPTGRRPWVVRTLDALILLVAFLTAVAAWFLMQTAFTVAMVLACLALPIAATLRARRVAR